MIVSILANKAKSSQANYWKRQAEKSFWIFQEMTDSSTKKSCWYVQIHRSNLFWQKHNEIRRGMFVSLRVMDRDLAMSSVHVSHRQTFSEWYIHKVQMVGSKCFILERICFVQLFWYVRRKMRGGSVWKAGKLFWMEKNQFVTDTLSSNTNGTSDW